MNLIRFKADTLMTAKQLTDEEKILLGISTLSWQMYSGQPKYILEAISDYVEFIAEHISYEDLTIDVSDKVLRQFEAVSIQLDEVLVMYPAGIQKRVSDIMASSDALNTIVAILSLTKRDLARIRSQHRLPHIILVVSRTFGDAFPSRLRNLNLTDERFLKLKSGLLRLAEVLRYAASLEYVDAEPLHAEYGSYFDPRKISTDRLFQQLQELRAEVQRLPASAELKDLLTRQTDELIRKVQSPRPRWGSIIATLFVLLSIVADAKSVFPETYDATDRVLKRVITTITTDAASSKPTPQQTGFPRLPERSDGSIAILPPPPRITEEDEEDDDGHSNS